MKKITFIFIMSLCGYVVKAQEQKSGCSPQACGPENTKLAEAAVLTNLRNDLVNLKIEIKNKNGLVEKTQVEKGATDDESLQIMIAEVRTLDKLLKIKPLKVSGNKANIVRELRNHLAGLSESLRKP